MDAKKMKNQKRMVKNIDLFQFYGSVRKILNWGIERAIKSFCFYKRIYLIPAGVKSNLSRKEVIEETTKDYFIIKNVMSNSTF